MTKIISSFLLTISLVLSNSVYAKTLKIATLSPDGSFWMTTMKEAAKQIAEQTDERVKFRFYPGGVMGNDKAVLKKMRIGQLHGAALSSGALESRAPNTQLYNIPLLFRTYAEVDHVRSQMDTEIEAQFEQAGYVNFGFAEAGFAYVMSRQRISAADDLKKNKVWVPSDDIASQSAADSFGIAPVALSLGDVLTGLQTGLIDTIAASPIAAIALQWHNQVNYVLDIPLVYVYALLAIDKKAFNKISSEDQAVVDKVMRDAFKKMDKQNRVDNQNAFSALENQNIKITQAEPEQLEEWKAKGEAAANDFVIRGKIDASLRDKIEKLLDEYRASQ